MKIKLKNTKLVDEHKRPVVFYHTSPVENIERFLPLSHFGTKKAADMRGMHFVYQTLGISEPATLPDKLPDSIYKQFSKLENAPQLFTYPVFLYSKSALKIPDFGKHWYDLRFNAHYRHPVAFCKLWFVVYGSELYPVGRCGFGMGS